MFTFIVHEEKRFRILNSSSVVAVVNMMGFETMRNENVVWDFSAAPFQLDEMLSWESLQV